MEETTAENVTEETATAVEEMDMETVKRTEETGETETENKTEETENIAISYQNRCNTRQTDGETILYML
jgi:hypothetical protein